MPKTQLYRIIWANFDSLIPEEMDRVLYSISLATYFLDPGLSLNE